MQRNTVPMGAILTAVSTLFFLGSSQAADILKYLFKDTPKPAYAITIRAELPDSVETHSGNIYYDIKSTDPANGQTNFGYSTALHTESTRSNPGPGGPPRPNFRDMFGTSGQQAPPDIVIDSFGNVIRTNRGGDDAQLPYSLGFAWQLLLPLLPKDGAATWSTERNISLYSKQGQPQQQWPPPPPFARRPQETRTERSAKETVTYTRKEQNGNLVTIERKYDLATDEKVGDVPVSHYIGNSTLQFDTQTGLVKSLDGKMTLELNEKNVSIKIPVTISARLLSAEEMAKIEADRKTAEAKAKADSEKAQTRDAEDRRQKALPLPTPEEAAAQIKLANASWQHTSLKPVELLPNMSGQSTKDADGTVSLSEHQRLTTHDSIRVPATFRIVALTQLNDTRIGYATRQIIFNWEFNRDQLRVDGGPINGQHKDGAGRLPAAQWVGIEMVVHKDELVLYVNGKEQYRAKGDFSTVNKPFSIECHSNGGMKLKSVSVVHG